jgi:hypothetical protein
MVDALSVSDAQHEQDRRTALGWQQRALIAERNWRICRRWAIAGGAPIEKLGDDPDTPWHKIRDRIAGVRASERTHPECEWCTLCGKRDHMEARCPTVTPGVSAPSPPDSSTHTPGDGG